MLRIIREYILGKKLSTHAIRHERLSNPQGLAIFSSDALSSTAYATEEILIVLAGAGMALSVASIPIAIVITALILIVTISYRQIIYAYPQGGGVYNVARKNLGELPALVGASSLLIDYVLTAAVSVAAGVAAITSAFPFLFSHRIAIGIVILFFLMWMNLRGVRESGRIFTMPTYFFIISFLGMIGYGIWRYLGGTYPIATPEVVSSLEPFGILGIFILFRAFASGCTAMTGIEATSNGVQAFRAPESANAARTILRMALLLGTIFLGITILANWAHIIPIPGETVISQIARNLFGRGIPYYAIQFSTALILLLAANTPFAGFPRVASQLAKDGYFPHQFLNLGSRLVFANGIMILALLAAFLLVLFQGSVHALIPLYAVGVFLGFSISQFGMIVHWKRKGREYRLPIIINTIGALSTAVVLVVVFFSKFTHGAWLLIPAGLLLVFFMRRIHRHYHMVEEVLKLDGTPVPDVFLKKTMVILIAQVNRATLHAMHFARSLRPARLRAVHVAIDQHEGEMLKKKWMRYVPEVPIDVLFSEYRDLIGPVLSYLKKMEHMYDNDEVIVVLPEFIPPQIWHHFLHNQTALRLRLAIEQDPEIQAEILDVPVKITTKLR